MAGTVTITEQTITSVKKVTFDWTCTTGGAASGTTTKKYDGEVLRVVLKGSSGTTGYALVINDSDSIDILEGAGSTCTSGTIQLGTGEAKSPVSCVAESALELSVTGSGSASTGKTIVYIR